MENKDIGVIHRGPTFHNYDFYTDFSGHSVVTTDDKGIIVETALPFRKFIGQHIDELYEHYRDRKSYNDIKELGKTKGGRLENRDNLPNKGKGM